MREKRVYLQQKKKEKRENKNDTKKKIKVWVCVCVAKGKMCGMRKFEYELAKNTWREFFLDLPQFFVVVKKVLWKNLFFFWLRKLIILRACIILSHLYARLCVHLILLWKKEKIDRDLVWSRCVDRFLQGGVWFSITLYACVGPNWV